MSKEGIFFMAFWYLAYYSHVKVQSLPSCVERCGKVKVAYPFGAGRGCFYSEDGSFQLSCNEKDKLLFHGNEVIRISDGGELRIWINISEACDDMYGSLIDGARKDYEFGNLSLSAKNKFTLVGCNAVALMSIYGIRNYSTGCLSLCNSPSAANGDCNGEGCCRTDVYAGLDSHKFKFQSGRLDLGNWTNMTSVHHFNPCTYAFLAENGTFDFNALEDLKNMRNVERFPVVLDWSIGKRRCKQVGRARLCGKNSKCIDSTTRTGYSKKGFSGNPYFSNENGCQDINECSNAMHNCSGLSTCENTLGSFHCNCPSDYHLNATSMSCTRKHKPEYFGWTQIILGTIIGFLLILLVATCVQQRMKHRKDTELRQQHFEQNGGGMLIQRLSGAESSNVDLKIYTEEGMMEATNGYHESRILGQGGQGTVYKGILPDNSIVAIKKARLGEDNSQIEQFINEVLVLSKINHRNVVKLLGCCLETQLPLLVYEFITSGTLFDHLHGSMSDSSLTWEHRLRIAIEIAGTLAYLHSSASVPIIHRDIKTANILLDENLTAKVADFGASRLIPMDKEQLKTIVQGTAGYVDPEYYNTGLLNEKSDTFSFGVVLMELLSGQKALCFERPQTSRHLVRYFASAMRENRLNEIIDGQVMNEENQREIQEAARIAVECTRMAGEERPKMKEVAAELEALRVTKAKHEWSDLYPVETEHLLGVEILSAQGETSSTATGYDSIKNVAPLETEAGL